SPAPQADPEPPSEPTADAVGATPAVAPPPAEPDAAPTPSAPRSSPAPAAATTRPESDAGAAVSAARTAESAAASTLPAAAQVGPNGELPLPRVIAIANQKGGAGKTTTAVNLGAALAEAGLRVLVVDLDPQGNATTGLGVNPRDVEHSIYDVLMHD